MLSMLLYIPLALIGVGLLGYVLPVIVFSIRGFCIIIAKGIKRISHLFKYKNFNIKRNTEHCKDYLTSHENTVLGENKHSDNLNMCNDIKTIMVTKSQSQPTVVELNAIAIDNVNKGLKRLKNIEMLISKISNKTKKEWVQFDYEKYKPKAIGDYEIIEHIRNMNKNMKYIYDIVLDYKGQMIQYDHIILTNGGIYVLDSSTLTGNIYVDSEENFFNIDECGNKKLIDNPINTQNEKAEMLLNKLNEFGIGVGCSIYSVIVLANKNATIKIEKDIQGLCPDFRNFLNNIDDFGALMPKINKIGYFLSEFNENCYINYLELYNLQPEDFFNLT